MKFVTRSIKPLQFFLLLTFSMSSNSFADLNLRSARLKFTRPATLHNLVFKDPNGQLPKTFFELVPKNNERIGVFIDLNSVLIGFNFDPFAAREETRTLDLDFATEKFSGSRLGLNFQILKGFESKAKEAFGGGSDSKYMSDVKSTKIELYGLHNFYTFYGKSRFDHFFLNRPVDGEQFIGLSLIGNWTTRFLDLESPTGVIYTPSFLNNSIADLAEEVRAFSAALSVGPMLSVSLSNRFNSYLEAKLGTGYFRSLNKEAGLKETGFETLQAYGAGLSYNTRKKDFLINLKYSFQKGRHIETSFAELGLIYFFKQLK